MKKAFYLMLASSAALFYACGDSESGTNAGGSSSQTIQQSGKITINTDASGFSAISKDTDEGCVFENMNYTWKVYEEEEDTDYIKYAFVGDTLVLFSGCESDFSYCSETGAMYVGGKGGSLDGTWHSILCKYDSEDLSSTCYELCSEAPTVTSDDYGYSYEYSYNSDCLTQSEMNSIPKTTLSISGSTFNASVTYNTGTTFNDYTNSEFMYRLLSNIQYGDFELPSTSNLFEEDSSEVSYLIKVLKSSDGITISQSPNKLTLNKGDKSISIQFNSVQADLYGRKVSMTVSSGTTNCPYNEEIGEVTPASCKAENGEFFEKYTTEDSLGNDITIAESYYKSNEKDFNQCVNKLYASFAEEQSQADTSDYEYSDDEPSSSYDADEVCAAEMEQYEACVLDYYNKTGSMDEDAILEACQKQYNSAVNCYGGMYKVPAVKVSDKQKFITEYRKLTKKLESISK